MYRSLSEQALTEIRAELEALDGVRRVLFDGPPYTVFLICQQSVTNATRVEMGARAVLHQAGFTPEDVPIQISFVAVPAPRHRVRFLDSSFQALGPTRAAATVSLEWDERVIEQRVEGESGPVASIRLPALATIRALETVVDGALRFELVGIKEIRVFDGDMIAAILRTERAPTRQLTGAVVVTHDLARAAALAVLHATNRVLGNYLTIGEEA